MNIMSFSDQLKKRSLAPSNIQISNWNNWQLVSCFNQHEYSFISENAGMGIDLDLEVATMKALTEFTERQIFKNSDDIALSLTERSDGVAAFPTHNINSKDRARTNAFNEAVERYVWSKWWDSSEILFSIKESKFNEKSSLIKEFNLVSLNQIEVPVAQNDIKLIILIAENSDGGFITGGAAGAVIDNAQTISRAFGELLRHLIVVKNMYNSKSQFENFYEKRLRGFGHGLWQSIVRDRLNSVGDKILELPNLIVDKEIIHPHSDLIIMHRCLFKDQPLFMGGRLERLCI